MGVEEGRWGEAGDYESLNRFTPSRSIACSSTISAGRNHSENQQKETKIRRLKSTLKI